MNKKHIIVPALLLIYLAIMTIVFGKDLIAAGEIVRFCTIVVTELVIIVLLYFVLRKNQQYRDRRRKDQ